MTELKAKSRNKLPAKDFAEPDKRAYPIEDKPHARNAKARASQAVKAGRMSKPKPPRSTKRRTPSCRRGDQRFIQGFDFPEPSAAACCRWNLPPRGGFGLASMAACLSRNAR